MRWKEVMELVLNKNWVDTYLPIDFIYTLRLR